MSRNMYYSVGEIEVAIPAPMVYEINGDSVRIKALATDFNYGIVGTLSEMRADVRAVLDEAPREVRHVLSALQEGRVDGTKYAGPCACLIGTIANARGCVVSQLGISYGMRGMGGGWRYAEVFFQMIRQHDTPENNLAARLAAAWVQEWLDEHEVRAEALVEVLAEPARAVEVEAAVSRERELVGV